jgi:hypothetical protein
MKGTRGPHPVISRRWRVTRLGRVATAASIQLRENPTSRDLDEGGFGTKTSLEKTENSEIKKLSAERTAAQSGGRWRVRSGATLAAR